VLISTSIEQRELNNLLKVLDKGSFVLTHDRVS
jgi:hypothetical protein